MEEFVNSIARAMESSLGAELTVFLLSMIPIAEARFAIPFGITMGMNPFEAFGWAFLGTTVITPLLLLILIPIINALSRTKFFSKIGKFLYDKFEKKSKSITESDNQDGQNVGATHKKKLSKKELEKMGGTALFVAVPIPLTGVWTGSAVASIVKLGFLKGLISVAVGNAVACSIITLICWAFAEYVTYITIAFAVIAICVVIFLIVKLILYKPKDAATADEATGGEAKTDKIQPEIAERESADGDDNRSS
ncbi:MAG: small multi-drug export protein [Clostridiales bacterium]|nr:small multi-drug export protein [Clostridiales bacterium]